METNQTAASTLADDSKLEYVPAHVGILAFLLGLNYADPSTPSQVATVARMSRPFLVPATARQALAAAWSETAMELSNTAFDDTDEAITEAGLTATAIMAQRTLGNGAADIVERAGLEIAAMADQQTGDGVRVET